MILLTDETRSMQKKKLWERVLSIVLSSIMIILMFPENVLNSFAEDYFYVAEDISCGNAEGLNGDVSSGDKEVLIEDISDGEEQVISESTGIIASGISRDCSWILDTDGKLTVRDSDGTYGTNNWGWQDYIEEIKSVDMDISYTNRLNAMFDGCTAMESATIKIDKGEGTANAMFDGCSSLTTLDVSGFNTENVTDMSFMFNDCSSLTTLDVSGFNTGNVIDMSCMFMDCSSLTTLDVSGFNTENVSDMSFMFLVCSSLTTLDVSGFNTENVTDMTWMFYGCSSLTTLDVSGFNTGNVTDMSCMFLNCGSLTTLDVGGFNTEKVTDMSGIFRGCCSLKTIDVKGFNTGNVTDMSTMFMDCSSLTTLDISGFNTGNVTDMSSMFDGCSSLTTLDVSGFNTENVNDMGCMFSGCYNLRKIKTFPNLTQSVDLPISRLMYDQDGNIYKQFPKGLSEGIWLFAEGVQTETDGSRVEYVLNGGENNYYNLEKVEAGKTLVLYAPEKIGYTFAGWYTDPNFKTKITKITGAKNKNYTLYAKWTEAKYTITYKLPTGAINNSKNLKTYKISTNTFELKPPTRKYMTFLGWYYDPQFNEPVTHIYKGTAGNLTLYSKWKSPKYTIIYDGNGATGGSTSNTNHAYLTSGTIANCGFTKAGYTFAGWTKNAKGTGALLQPGNTKNDLSYTEGTTITLYAKWTPNKYTVRYSGNWAHSGKTNDSKFTYDAKTTIAKNGYKMTGYTFVEWNTEPDGSGTSYFAGQKGVFNMTTDTGTVMLYAIWKPISYKVAFKAEKGQSMDTITVTYDESKNLPKCTLYKKGCIFKGWTLNAAGTGTLYKDQGAILNLCSTAGKNVTLYPQWQYPVNFVVNGGSGTMEKVYLDYGKSVKLPNATFEKCGYEVSSWKGMLNGKTVTYKDGASVKNLLNNDGTEVNLSAQWKPIQYTVFFLPNTGNASYDKANKSKCKITATYDKEFVVPANTFKKAGYVFTGWKSASDGRILQPGDRVSNLTDLNICIDYEAQWTEDIKVTGLNLSQSEVKIGIGKPVEMMKFITVVPENAVNKEMTWTSSNTSVATVDASGNVTGKKEGTAIINVKSKSNTKVSTSVKVTVTRFSPRQEPPKTDNEYYYSTKNPFHVKTADKDLTMPNCTTYAWGRVFEINDEKPNLSIGAASSWWNDNLNSKAYLYSSNAYEPAIGAVICFAPDSSGSSGHVMVVEEIGCDDEGKMYLKASESNWSGRSYPDKCFNYKKIYLDDLEGYESSSLGHCIRTYPEEDNDGYNDPVNLDGSYPMGHLLFQGYIYACGK